MHPLGLTLAGFTELLDSNGGRARFAAGGSLSHPWTTADLKRHLVLDLTAEAKCSYAQLLLSRGSPHVGPAGRFVSHAYSYCFLDVLDTLAAWEGAEASRSHTFYYFDLLVVNQHAPGSADVPYEQLKAEFGSSVRAISHTLLLLMWDSPAPLQRAWCVCEIGISVDSGAALEVLVHPRDSQTLLQLIEPDFQTMPLHPLQYINGLLGRVNMESAQAFKEEDKVLIHRLVNEELGGFEALDGSVKEAIKDSIIQLVLRQLQGGPTAQLAVNFAGWLQRNGRAQLAKGIYIKAVQDGAEGGVKFTAISGLASIFTSSGELREAVALWATSARDFINIEGGTPRSVALWVTSAEALREAAPEGISCNVVAHMLMDKEGGMLVLGNKLRHSGDEDNAEQVYTMVLLYLVKYQLTGRFAEQVKWITATYPSAAELMGQIARGEPLEV